MIKYDFRRAKQAVQYLVDTSYFSHHLKKIKSSVGRPRALPFRDEQEVLNELLIIGRQSLQAMENLIAVAEFKRDNKNDYQRKFMAAKRQRDGKVIRLEEMLLGKKLSLDERKDVLLKQYVTWNKERDTLLKRIANASWADRNEALREFWERKELEVDMLINDAGSAQATHKRRKYTVVVNKPEPKTTMGQKLKKALDKRH